ncbi:MAG: divalent-cation tolerance protein CutA [Proteobacteria bacterium]|nr:divalent-cation tolerance protein CutA [Pseudomonadota bacterium]
MVAASTETDVCVAFATAPDEAVALRIARALVEERLAACANLVPGVRSIYRFRGVVEDEREVLLVIKTCADRIEALAERLRALHPYEVPELVVMPTAGGLAPYLDWVSAETRP